MITILIKKKGESDFTDRSDQIRALSINQGTTKEASTARISVDYYAGKYKPEGEDEVNIYDGETQIFGGFIVRAIQRIDQGPVVSYDCDLKNRVYRLDYKLVNTTYESQSAHDIIEDIVANFSGPGITTDNVQDPGGTITFISFNNIPPSEAIQKLADVLGKEWYIDPAGDIHFFSKFGEAAPFSIIEQTGSNTEGNHIFGTLEITDDFTQIRNSIQIEGGKEISSLPTTEKYIGDGQTYTFPLGHEFASGLTVSVGGVSKTVGAANLNTFDQGYDVLYDPNTLSIQFPSSSPPANAAAILVSGNYYYQITVRFRELGSVAKYGERQFVIQDRDISSRADAVKRAGAEITAYSQMASEGSFQTYNSGLAAGQKITISSPIRGISSKQFVIQRLSGRMITPSKFLWKATIVSVKTYELIDLLADIIKSRRIEVDKDAVIQTADRVQRTIQISRTITVREPVAVSRTVEVSRDVRSYLNSPPTWVAGPFVPPNIDDRRRVAFTDRRCILAS